MSEHCWHGRQWATLPDVLNLGWRGLRTDRCCWCGSSRNVTLASRPKEGHGPHVVERENYEVDVGQAGPCPEQQKGGAP